MELLEIGVRSCKVSASQFIGRFRGKPLTGKIKTMTMQSRLSRALIAKGVRKSIVIIHFRSVACSAKSLQLSADRLFERKNV